MLHARATSDARNRPKTTLGARRRHARRPWAEHRCGHLARACFAPHPTTPVPCERSRRDAPEDVRVAHGLEEALAQCPAKGRAKCQRTRGAHGAGQGGNHAAAQSGLTRVRGAECAQGIMRALRDGLRGHARAILATSLLHILTHLYLVEDRRQDGHHTGVSGRGIMPPPYCWEPSSREPRRPATAAARALRPRECPWQQAHFVATCSLQVR